MRFFRQFLGILGVNLSGAAQRSGSVLTIIVGVTCAVGVLIAMLAMGIGVQREGMADVRADRVILNSTGTRGFQSSIPKNEAVIARDLPGIKRNADGAPIVVFESLIPIEAHRRVTEVRTFFPLVGTTANFAEYRPEIRLTGGRVFHPGLQPRLSDAAISCGFRCVSQRTASQSDAAP